MAARSTVVVDVFGLVIVRVDHGIADSFRRSVMPASIRGWRRAINCSTQTRCREMNFAPDWTVNGTRCASFAAFASSHDAASGALAAHLDWVKPAQDLTNPA